MRSWIFYGLLFIGFHKVHGQGTMNAASENIVSPSIEITFVFGGGIINAISNNAFSIIPSSIPIIGGLTTEVKQVKYEGPIAYPNPFPNTLYLNLNNISLIEIHDSKGTVVKSVGVSNGGLDVHDLSQGLYILRVHDGRNTYMLKVVKYETH